LEQNIFSADFALDAMVVNLYPIAFRSD